MSCKVKGCRFNSYHITRFHQCGKCKETGHGMIECGDNELCKNLVKYYNDNIAKPCKSIFCDDRHTHTTEGHICLFCNKNTSNHLRYCPKDNSVGKELEDNSLIEKYNYLKNGEYSVDYAGMGCSNYIRRNIFSNKLELIFMHSDMWGQYGDDTSELPIFKAFIYKYNEIKT
jgi:hypothetical protein